MHLCRIASTSSFFHGKVPVDRKEFVSQVKYLHLTADAGS
jgi:hypothetical protein